MTRKKWNRLRRQRPELFARLPSWESLDIESLGVMRRVGKSEAITQASAAAIAGTLSHWFVETV